MIDLNEISGNKKFCHYTSLDNARKIVNSGTIWLSKYSQMNDISESKKHIEQEKQIFSTCFCHSSAKSIPMFYLYSGIDGKGCRLEFTAAKIKEILKDVSIYPVNNKGYQLKTAFEKSQYSVHANWIYYVSRSGYYTHKNDMSHEYKSDSQFLEAIKGDRDKFYFVKNKVWEYEKEFRIVVCFHNEIMYDRIAVSVPIKEKERGISLTCGPEILNCEVEKIKEEFHEYGIQNIYAYSDEKIQIKMDLVNKNKHLLMKR